MAVNFTRWIYHATEKPIIISSDEFEKYESEGWAGTPAKFAKIKDFGIDENDEAAVQVLGEALEGVNDRLNGELNIGRMSKDQLFDFANKHFNYSLDQAKGVRALRKQVREMVAA